MSRLKGRVAIVTGGGHGIGKAYVQRLAREGARLVVAEIDGPAANAVAAECTAQNLDVIAVRTDVSDEASTREMAVAALDAFGRIDILVNNAAIFATVAMSRVAFDQIDPAEWDRMMAVNLRGAWFACRAVVPQMRTQKYGKIINISSGTVWERVPLRIHYVTSKAGIIGFTRTLAAELGADNICVNCIAPGSTLSEEHPTDEILGFRRAAAEQRLLQRVQTPEDLVGPVVFFASSDSDFITGQTLLVDGGSAVN